MITPKGPSPRDPDALASAATVLGLDIDALSDAAPLALRGRLSEVLAQLAQPTPAADQRRMAAIVAAAQLSDDRLLAALRALPVAESRLARRATNEELHAVLAELRRVVAISGGWNARARRRLLHTAAARRLSAPELALCLEALLPAPAAIAAGSPAVSPRPRAPSQVRPSPSFLPLAAAVLAAVLILFPSPAPPPAQEQPAALSADTKPANQTDAPPAPPPIRDTLDTAALVAREFDLAAEFLRGDPSVARARYDAGMRGLATIWSSAAPGQLAPLVERAQPVRAALIARGQFVDPPPPAGPLPPAMLAPFAAAAAASAVDDWPAATAAALGDLAVRALVAPDAWAAWAGVLAATDAAAPDRTHAVLRALTATLSAADRAPLRLLAPAADWRDTAARRWLTDTLADGRRSDPAIADLLSAVRDASSDPALLRALLDPAPPTPATRLALRARILGLSAPPPAEHAGLLADPAAALLPDSTPSPNDPPALRAARLLRLAAGAFAVTANDQDAAMAHLAGWDDPLPAPRPPDTEPADTRLARLLAQSDDPASVLATSVPTALGPVDAAALAERLVRGSTREERAAALDAALAAAGDPDLALALADLAYALPPTDDARRLVDTIAGRPLRAADTRAWRDAARIALLAQAAEGLDPTRSASAQRALDDAAESLARQLGADPDRRLAHAAGILGDPARTSPRLPPQGRAAAAALAAEAEPPAGPRATALRLWSLAESSAESLRRRAPRLSVEAGIVLAAGERAFASATTAQDQCAAAARAIARLASLHAGLPLERLGLSDDQLTLPPAPPATNAAALLHAAEALRETDPAAAAEQHRVALAAALAAGDDRVASAAAWSAAQDQAARSRASLLALAGGLDSRRAPASLAAIRALPTQTPREEFAELIRAARLGDTARFRVLAAAGHASAPPPPWLVRLVFQAPTLPDPRSAWSSLIDAARCRVCDARGLTPDGSPCPICVGHPGAALDRPRRAELALAELAVRDTQDAHWPATERAGRDAPATLPWQR